MDSIKSTTPCDDLGAICVWCWCVRGAELLLGCCCHRGAQCVPERGWIEFTPAWTALDSWPLLLLKKLVRGLWSSPFWSSVGPAVLRRPHVCLCVWGYPTPGEGWKTRVGCWVCHPTHSSLYSKISIRDVSCRWHKGRAAPSHYLCALHGSSWQSGCKLIINAQYCFQCKGQVLRPLPYPVSS